MQTRSISFFKEPSATQPPTSFQDLPNDLLHEILQRLDPASIQKFIRLNRRYHDIIHQSFKANPMLTPLYEKRDLDLKTLRLQHPFSSFSDRNTQRALDTFSFLSLMFILLIACIILGKSNQHDSYSFLLSTLAIFTVGIGLPMSFVFLAAGLEPFLKKQDEIYNQFLGDFKRHISNHNFVTTPSTPSKSNAIQINQFF